MSPPPPLKLQSTLQVVTFRVCIVLNLNVSKQLEAKVDVQVSRLGLLWTNREFRQNRALLVVRQKQFVVQGQSRYLR